MAQSSRYLKVGELLTILNDLWRGHDTGTLVLQRESTTKFLYFQDGQVIFAASNAPEDKFTQILIDQGRLTVEQVNLATQKRESRTLGRTLVDMGFISSEGLLEALIAQVRKIALSVAEWASGTSSFKPNVLPPGVAKLPITTERLVLDTLAGMHDRTWVGQTLGGLESVFKISSSDKAAALEMPLSAEERKILDAMDGRRSVREICEATGVDAFVGARFFLGLFYLHFAHRKEVLVPQHHTEGKVDLSFLDDVVPPPPPPESVAPPSESVAPPPDPEPPPPPVPAEVPGLTFSAPPAQEMEPETLQKFEIPPEEPQDVLREEVPPPDVPDSPSGTGWGGAPPPPPEGGADELLLRPVADRPSALPVTKTKRRSLSVGIFALFVVAIAVLVAVWWFVIRSPGEPSPEPGPEIRKPATEPPATRATGAPALPSNGVNQPEVAPAAHGSAPSPVPSEPLPVQNAPVPAPAKPLPGPNAAVQPPASPAPAPSKPPQPAKAEDLMRAGKFPEAAAAFEAKLRTAKAGYTIDVEIACQPDTLAKGYAAAQGNPAFMVIPYRFRGRSCYRVIWGTFASRAEAEAALMKLPAHFLGDANPPKVRSWSEVRPGP